jgi:uncharacterized membrane protein YvbJ
MALVFCRECGKQISDQAASCPHCGAPQKTEAPTIEREVSAVWTFLFGGIYFLVKGWFKAGIAALVISFFTGFIAWFIIPFFARKFVDSFEGK